LRLDVASGRLLEQRQLGRELRARSVQPDREGGRATAGGARRAGSSKPVPGDQHQRLAVAMREPGQSRSQELCITDAVPRITRPDGDRGGRDAPIERRAAIAFLGGLLASRCIGPCSRTG
jgi:hypothetical protein